eukprot:COSAG03_NODE_2720_length_2498_cov_2.215090_2_plen_154_part_01
MVRSRAGTRESAVTLTGGSRDRRAEGGAVGGHAQGTEGSGVRGAAMGRITVFSTATCPHCKRAKALLAEKGWDFTEVSLSDYPEKRGAMLQLADKLSVPQIFFNETHLGGAAELAALEERGELQALYEEMAAAPEPTDARLAKPDYEPVPPAAP